MVGTLAGIAILERMAPGVVDAAAMAAIARVLRADCRLYSVSPTPTMQYLSLSDAMGSSAPRLYARAPGGVKPPRPRREARAVGGA